MIKKVFIITSTGTGEFPWDMLRHDECWPRNTGDAMRMSAPLVPGTGIEERDFWSKPRTVELLSHRIPSPARWASFNWVIDVEEVRHGYEVVHRRCM